MQNLWFYLFPKLAFTLWLEIKTFGLVLKFEMSLQQQQHSIAFTYAAIQWPPRSLGPIFLNWGQSSNLIVAV